MGPYCEHCEKRCFQLIDGTDVLESTCKQSIDKLTVGLFDAWHRYYRNYFRPDLAAGFAVQDFFNMIGKNNIHVRQLLREEIDRVSSSNGKTTQTAPSH